MFTETTQAVHSPPPQTPPRTTPPDPPRPNMAMEWMNVSDFDQAQNQQKFTLIYFGIYAKGLGPTLVAQWSGLPWIGAKEYGFTGRDWAKMKADGFSPFGQLPVLMAANVGTISQAVAISNYIARRAGPTREGAPGKDWATSQMLYGAAEDLYGDMQQYLPTVYVTRALLLLLLLLRAATTYSPTRLSQVRGPRERRQRRPGGVRLVPVGGRRRAPRQAREAVQARRVRLQLHRHGALFGGRAGEFAFAAGAARRVAAVVPHHSPPSPSPQHLWAYVHQLVLVKPSLLEGGATPKLLSWYGSVFKDLRTQAVLRGKSPAGPIAQYFERA